MRAARSRAWVKECRSPAPITTHTSDKRAGRNDRKNPLPSRPACFVGSAAGTGAARVWATPLYVNATETKGEPTLAGRSNRKWVVISENRRDKTPHLYS